jgi:acetoin utilization deacetylase AcuC-like enzyme
MTTTAYVTHPDYNRHTLAGHPEHAGRIERIWQVFDGAGMSSKLMRVIPEPATTEQLARVHDPRYVQHVRKAAETGGGMLDPDTYVLPASYDIAL